MKNEVELGDEAECKVTGFKGIVNGRSQWLTGCNRVSIQGPMKKDGTMGESYWVDEAAVKVLKKQKVKMKDVQESEEKPLRKVGGPPTRIAQQ